VHLAKLENISVNFEWSLIASGRHSIVPKLLKFGHVVAARTSADNAGLRNLAALCGPD